VATWGVADLLFRRLIVIAWRMTTRAAPRFDQHLPHDLSAVVQAELQTAPAVLTCAKQNRSEHIPFGDSAEHLSSSKPEQGFIAMIAVGQRMRPVGSPCSSISSTSISCK
jgi:hypothetical protein